MELKFIIQNVNNIYKIFLKDRFKSQNKYKNCIKIYKYTKMLKFIY